MWGGKMGETSHRPPITPGPETPVGGCKFRSSAAVYIGPALPSWHLAAHQAEGQAGCLLSTTGICRTYSIHTIIYGFRP